MNSFLEVASKWFHCIRKMYPETYVVSSLAQDVPEFSLSLRYGEMNYGIDIGF